VNEYLTKDQYESQHKKPYVTTVAMTDFKEANDTFESELRKENSIHDIVKNLNIFCDKIKNAIWLVRGAADDIYMFDNNLVNPPKKEYPPERSAFSLRYHLD
jgi:hypothetical protein